MMGRRPRRKGTVAGAGALGVATLAAIATAAVALACTTIMTQLTISPTSGPPGTVVTTNVSSPLKPNATYEIQLGHSQGIFISGSGIPRADGNYGQDCMDTTGVDKLASVTTNASGGGWSNVRVTIPAGTSMGPHEICGVETAPVPVQTGTTHETFTVIGL